MSAQNGVYDPYGLAVPVTVKGKMKMKKLWTLPSWDTPLDESDLHQWCLFFVELLKLNTLTFPRSIYPVAANNNINPILVSFSDGSEEAFGCCIYVRWELLDGTFSSRLLASKSRVAPLKTTTVVRLELSAAVMAKRLRKAVEDAFKLEFSRVIHILDSRIVKGMISNESYGFKTFAATRIGEIQTATKPEEWFWIESKLNIADIISRGATVEDIGPDSEWQNGKDFMKHHVDEWPLHQDFPTSGLPEQVKQVSTIVAENHIHMINIERFSSFIKLLRVTARILMLVGMDRSFKVMMNPITSNRLKEAETYWVRQAQCQPAFLSQLEDACKGKGSLRKLNIQKVDGLFIAAGRIGAWNEFTFNKKDLPILSSNHKFSELYARHIHNQAHRGPRADIAKIRTVYWIVGVQRLAKRIRHNCVDCRRLHGELQQQVMAPLPIERLKPAPMWHFSGIDLFGPLPIKGEVNKRSVGKGYGVIFTCLLTRAVYFDISCDYSSDAFLLVLRRFASLKGYPAKIYSDVGSQLGAASRELQEMFNEFDWSKIKDETVHKGLEWEFSPP